MSPEELLRLRLPCDAEAPRLARQALSELGPLAPVRDDAMLVVSELATNAVRHSGSTAQDELELVAELTSHGVRIAVTDSGRSGEHPAVRDREPLEPGGMGLTVVQAVARAGGTRRDDSVSVWAELAL